MEVYPLKLRKTSGGSAARGSRRRAAPSQARLYRFAPGIRADLKQLAVLDNWHTLVALVRDYLLILSAIYLGKQAWWVYPIAVCVIGAQQRALATILHEAAHGHAAKAPRLNYCLGTYLSGFLIFQSFRAYRQSHVAMHHGYLGNVRYDPDLQFYLAAGLYDGLTPRQFVWRHVGATLLLLKIPAYLWYLVQHRVAALRLYPQELLAMTLFWGCLIGVLWVGGVLPDLVLYWLVPDLTSFMIIGRFVEIAEHYPLLGTQPDVLSSTRNRFSHWLEGFFFSIHAENYHLVHHLRPDIPFWHVKQAHQVMLRDTTYRTRNATFGGIFLSANRQTALIPALSTGTLALPTTAALTQHDGADGVSSQAEGA